MSAQISETRIRDNAKLIEEKNIKLNDILGGDIKTSSSFPDILNFLAPRNYEREVNSTKFHNPVLSLFEFKTIKGNQKLQDYQDFSEETESQTGYEPFETTDLNAKTSIVYEDYVQVDNVISNSLKIPSSLLNESFENESLFISLMSDVQQNVQRPILKAIEKDIIESISYDTEDHPLFDNKLELHVFSNAKHFSEGLDIKLTELQVSSRDHLKTRIITDKYNPSHSTDVNLETYVNPEDLIMVIDINLMNKLNYDLYGKTFNEQYVQNKIKEIKVFNFSKLFPEFKGNLMLIEKGAWELYQWYKESVVISNFGKLYSVYKTYQNYGIYKKWNKVAYRYNINININKNKNIESKEEGEKVE